MLLHLICSSACCVLLLLIIRMYSAVAVAGVCVLMMVLVQASCNF
jgi:hypothetical protein